MTESENYKGLLLALCKYHQNLKEDVQYLRSKAETTEKEPAKKGIIHKATTVDDQRKAILWMLFRRKPDLEKFFGTHEPETIATHPFFDEDSDLAHVDTVPVRFLGIRRKDANGNEMGKVINWRLRGLGL